MTTIFEDESLLVLDKPPGLVVTPSETQKEPTLVDWLENYFGHCKDSIGRYAPSRMTDRMGIVHRLDKDTSGIILVAKTKAAFEDLQAQFKNRVVKKEYLALVHGLLEEAGKVEGAIERNPENREKFVARPTRSDAQDFVGRWAATEYIPVEKLKVKSEKLKVIFEDFNKIQMRKLEKMGYGQFTLVRCKPLTGRTHQIRVHLKYIGHPIVSDEKYVGRKMYRLDHRWCPRQFLHAAKIGFKHPKSGAWIELESKLPEDLRKVLWITFSYNWP